MYYLDSLRNKDGSRIYRTKAGFRYPLSKDRNGQYKVKSGEMLRVCMTSDFFLEEADPWRDEAWEIIRRRPDVKFYLLTKRPERVADHLPSGWRDGWENVMFNVTCENQRRADERIPILLDLPFKIVKIDKSLVWSYFNGTSDVLPDIVKTFSKRGYEIVAEGVETHNMAEKLRDMGCDYLQGFYFSKALPADQLVSYVYNNRRLRIMEEMRL